jgi:hypothetical protein
MGVPCNTPAVCGVGQATQGVHHRVQVGRDVQAPEYEVVCGIDDNREFGGWQSSQPFSHSGAAHTTRQRDDSILLLTAHDWLLPRRQTASLSKR